jgi:O-antigen/teichoic acid export membrane protein
MGGQRNVAGGQRHVIQERGVSEERRVGNALAILLGWYAVLGTAAFLVLLAVRPDQDLAWIVAPIAAVAAVIVAPATLAVLAQGRRRFSSLALATVSIAAGLAFVVVASLIALALR